MKSMDPDPLQRSFCLHAATVAVLGYDADAREHAQQLRLAGNKVRVGASPDSLCAARARNDGFEVDAPEEVVKGVEVVAVLGGDHDTWRRAEAFVPVGALVVFSCARSLDGGACTRAGFDVVLAATVDREHSICRLAVHRDVTHRALVRAVGYARAACGLEVALLATSVEAEADLELASISERAGSVLAVTSEFEKDELDLNSLDEERMWRGPV